MEFNPKIGNMYDIYYIKNKSLVIKNGLCLYNEPGCECYCFLIMNDNSGCSYNSMVVDGICNCIPKRRFKLKNIYEWDIIHFKFYKKSRRSSVYKTMMEFCSEHAYGYNESTKTIDESRCICLSNNQLRKKS